MNEAIKSIKSSASMDLMAKAKELKMRGVDVVDLAGGEPDFDTPKAIKDVAISEICRGNTHYAVGKGLPKLRKKIAEKLQKDNNILVSPDEIIVTPGGKMAIYLIVRACINPGDEVIILNPGWVSYKEIVVAAGGIPVPANLSSKDNYQITTEILEKCVSLKTKMLILNTPNNPTGRVLNEDELSVLKKFVEKWNVLLLSDEIYEKIIYDSRTPLSPASDEFLRNKTITVNGFSKAYAMTGWRLGYLAGDKQYIDIINKLYTHTITGTSPFIQEAAIVALDCEQDVERMRQIYETRRDFFISGLNEISGVQAAVPEGAFYAWVNIEKDNMNGAQIANYLLEEGNVVGVPGNAYGMCDENYIRFSFANDMEDLKRALQRIEEALIH